ncbi:hypothetical protein CQW23_09386 [Capsicum baccatum]|uniref:Uncharacterized protein n=1 Tax=Capsicum baccatum TaxID=33114 RepID=A0A2G2WWU4_CAPBA|nr:hypothetical protein CQW23_09386 [Capsicum baccatum]
MGIIFLSNSTSPIQQAKQFLTAPSSPSPTYPPTILEKIYISLKIVQDIVVESQERNKHMLSSIFHVRSVLQEEMQLDSTSIDTLENSDAINITSNTEVAYMVKSHLDSELPVFGDGDTILQYIFSDVLSGASIDATKLKFSPLSFSVKGPLEFDCKVFDRLPKRDISAEFPSSSAPIGSLPPVLSINDYKWVDTGQLHDSFDMLQYNQIKLLGCAPLLINAISFSSDAPKLFDKIAERSRCFSMLYDSEYIGEVEELIECSYNLTSFCYSYKLLGISIENLFLYPFDRAAISSVERYAIDEFRHVEANCERNISVDRYILETANNFSGNPRSYICPLSYSMTRATILSLWIELSSSEQVEPGLPLLLRFNFGWLDVTFAQQVKVEGILLLVGKIEGSFDYDYDSWVVYVPNGEFLSSISPTDLKYWERYTGPDSVKEWRKYLDILLPMLAPIGTLYSIWVTYGAYIVVCYVDSKIIKATVLHNEIVVQEIKSNIVLCTTKIQKFCNEHTPLEADLVLVDGRTWLEVKPFFYSSATFIIFTKFFIHTFDPGILNIRITDDIDLAMHSHSGTPATYYLIAMLGREQLGGLVMGEVGTDAFVNFDKMAKSSDLVFLLSEMVMFNIHKSNGPLYGVVKKCSLMFFEISENRAEHNNLYEAISNNIQFGILLATNSLALSSWFLNTQKWT